MERKILLDTNLIIAAFDNQSPEAINQLAKLLSDENVAFAISPLIRYEVLRGIPFSENERHNALNALLNEIEEFDIGNDTAILSSNLFRFAKLERAEGECSIVDKRNFDVFHLATAKCNELELYSNDGDLDKLENLYQRWLKSQSN